MGRSDRWNALGPDTYAHSGVRSLNGGETGQLTKGFNNGFIHVINLILRPVHTSPPSDSMLRACANRPLAVKHDRVEPLISKISII